MSFKKKIDNLLMSNKLNVNSVYALERAVKASTGSINKYYNVDKEPGLGTIKKIKKTFGITDQEWERLDMVTEPTGYQRRQSEDYVPAHVLDHYRNTAEHIMSENRNLWDWVNELRGSVGKPR